MNPAQRHQLLQIDRAVLHLLDERARLVAEIEPAASRGAAAEPAVDDLLRRHRGPFPGAHVRTVFAAVRAGCSGVDGHDGGER